MADENLTKEAPSQPEATGGENQPEAAAPAQPAGGDQEQAKNAPENTEVSQTSPENAQTTPENAQTNPENTQTNQDTAPSNEGQAQENSPTEKSATDPENSPSGQEAAQPTEEQPIAVQDATEPEGDVPADEPNAEDENVFGADEPTEAVPEPVELLVRSKSGKLLDPSAAQIPELEVMEEANDDDHREVEIETIGATRRGTDQSGVNITGDFAFKPAQIFGSEESVVVQEISEEGGEEEQLVEEESVMEESVQEEELDRDKIYESYIKTIQEYNLNKRKNLYLMRKMAEYYKKRRMDHVLKEGENYEENLRKYYMKLDAFGELKELEERERKTITLELNQMRAQRNLERDQLKKDFEVMQAKERHIGIGLTFIKTGKQIPDKLVERYLRNQRQKTNELSQLRVSYIRMRDRIQEKQVALDDLDKIGDNFHLMDYEQLKIENRNHNDKIEERDEELSRLREKCIAAIECLAHIREKSAEVQLQIVEHTTMLEEVEMESWECRERVNYFKLERDNLRAEIERLKEESGLLTKGKLLCDMEASQKDREKTKEELAVIIADYDNTKSLIAQLKSCIEDIETKIRFFGPIKRDDGVKSKNLERNKSFSPKDPVEYSHISFGH